VIVLTRGGGSIEDLWAFNEEVVARAVAASAIPVVSAVGHEIDFTIADFAADLRAPTPSAAAEMIFREKQAIEAHLSSIEGRFKNGLKSRAAFFRERLAHLATRLEDPGRRVTEQRLRLDQLSEELVRAVRESLRDQRGQVTDTVGRLNAQDPRVRLVRIRDQWRELEKRLERSPGRGQDLRRHRLSALAGRLSGLSPLAVLERGYALVHREPDHRTVRSADDVAVGDVLSILLGRGELAARVQSITKPPAKPSNS
jgi:exodeoxyribonuclease VII large subunit